MKIGDRRLVRFGFILAFCIVAADQASKAWMLGVVEAGPITLLPIFNLVQAWNPGISFSLLHDAGPMILSGLAIAIAAAMSWWLIGVTSPLLAAGIGCVIGGALGNVIDRVRFGAVFDFLDFHWEDWHFPAFNLADSAITIGVVLLLFDGLFQRGDRAKT